MQNWGVNGFWGDPYALLQGSLAAMSETPPFEGHPVVAKGDVCIIPGSKVGTAARGGAGAALWGDGADSCRRRWRCGRTLAVRTQEFFIATAKHDEWGTAHSVWGKVTVSGPDAGG